jgi:uncharacterized membrane protein YfhO
VIEGKIEDGAGSGGVAKVIRHSSERVEIQLSEPASGWLVFADSWYPEWKAKVDGKSREISKADLAFMVIRINKGDRIVVFSYANDYKRYGWFLTAAAMVLCLLIAVSGPLFIRPDS